MRNWKFNAYKMFLMTANQNADRTNSHIIEFGLDSINDFIRKHSGKSQVAYIGFIEPIAGEGNYAVLVHVRSYKPIKLDD